jgi:hypothetical protein
MNFSFSYRQSAMPRDVSEGSSMSDQPKSNCSRSLGVIAGEIHKLRRDNVFAIGALLTEARDGPDGKHGRWMEWLEQFDFSASSADRYMSAHRLSLKFPTVRNLPIPATIN